ncbi:MAG: 23S rRNA (adenine(2503)-C(2))-methyltransferase RlmN [candidate division KSB1 bacterium]|nr:23S rRNA (adenine(2503)-C(2))-methyltransferase RlmN [candidate division KSB1 bacterium]
MNNIKLIGLNLEELERFVLTINEKRFRASQLFAWLYRKAATNFEEMTDLSRGLRAKLTQLAEIGNLTLVKSVHSTSSGVLKFLFELPDGLRIESVFIPEGKRKTLCLSTQVGCALACRFCATGKMGFKRNLTAGEIVGQILFIKRHLETEITNVVLMGMGEPFLNYENVIKACSLMSHPDGLAIGHRKIVISTSGIVPEMVRLADEGHKYRLAISLNAATDEVRNRLMPINRKYPLSELINAAKYYWHKIRLRPTFEYILLAGYNDRTRDAYELRRLVENIPCKINLIPYNHIHGEFQRPTESQILKFAEALYPLSAPVIIRWSKGDDIDAACGQLCYQSDK